MNTNVSAGGSNSFKHDKKSSHLNRINEERMAFAMSCLIDKEVEISLEDGTTLKGVFNSFDPGSRGCNRAIDIAVNSYPPSSGGNANGPHKPTIVYGNEYHFFSSHGISKNLLKPRDAKVVTPKKTVPSKFKTDTEISGSKQTKVNSVLTEWKSPDSIAESQLVDLDKGEGGEWDQFETNSREYGVVSTFDENLYTTSLNLNEIPDSVKEKAEMLAAEIENNQETSYAQVEAALEDEDAANEANSPPKGVKDMKRKDKANHLAKPKKFGSNEPVQERQAEHMPHETDKPEFERHPGPMKAKERHYSHQIGINALNIEPTNPRSDSLTERTTRFMVDHERPFDRGQRSPPFKVDERGTHHDTGVADHPRPNFRTSPPRQDFKQDMRPEHKYEPRPEYKQPPAPEPKYEPRYDGKQEGRAEYRPEPRPEPRFEPRQDARPDYRPAEARYEPRQEYRQDQRYERSEARVDTRSEQTTERPEYRPAHDQRQDQAPDSRPEPRPDYRPDHRPEYRQDPRYEPRQDYRAEPKGDQRADSRPETRTAEPRPDPRYEPKQEPRPEPRPETTGETRHEPPAEVKPEGRPDHRPEYRDYRTDYRADYRHDPRYEPRQDHRYERQDPRYEPMTDRQDPRYEPREPHMDSRAVEAAPDQRDQTTEPRLEPRYETRGDPRYEPRPDHRYDHRPDPRYDGRVDTAQDQRADPRYDHRADPRYDPRYDGRHEYRPDYRPDYRDYRSDYRPDYRHDPRYDNGVDYKQDYRQEYRQEPRYEPRPDQRFQSKSNADQKKMFKFNPNASSFTPGMVPDRALSPARPVAPVQTQPPAPPAQEQPKQEEPQAQPSAPVPPQPPSEPVPGPAPAVAPAAAAGTSTAAPAATAAPATTTPVEQVCQHDGHDCQTREPEAVPPPGPVPVKGSSPKSGLPKRSEFKPFKTMPRFPRLDLRGFKDTDRGKFSDYSYSERWTTGGHLSYRDVLGDLTPLHPHHPVSVSTRTPMHTVPPAQMPVMMPQGPQMHYPPYQMAPHHMSMMQYGPQMPQRFFNNFQYNQMMSNHLLARRNHMAGPNPQFGPFNMSPLHSMSKVQPMPNEHFFKMRMENFDDKHKGYGHHYKLAKK